MRRAIKRSRLRTSSARGLDQASRSRELVTPLQRLADASPQVARLARVQASADASASSGVPARLRAGIEQLSGVSLAGVRVHYGSSRPAELDAHAYTQGSDIHLGPAQERHLAHEAWHVVQQRQGRVRPTSRAEGRAINDDAALEREADRMGARAMRETPSLALIARQATPTSAGPAVVQRVSDSEVEAARDLCKTDTKTSIPLYSKGWKGKSNATKRQIWTTIKSKESTWYDNRDHIMKGDNTTPPKGYHSVALGGGANAVGVGAKNPGNVSGRGVYKQWIKKRGQEDNSNLKISTFFPDNWDETKVRACALLSHVGQDHQMSDQLALDSPSDATYYPSTNLANPTRPT